MNNDRITTCLLPRYAAADRLHRPNGSTLPRRFRSTAASPGNHEGLLPHARSTWLGSGNVAVLIAAMILCVTGCQPPVAEFTLNGPYMERQASDNSVAITPEQIEDVSNILTALFGTPDEPVIPVGMEQLVKLENLQLAAGPVRTTELGSAGLYRRHCAHCHGVTGDGLGPTAEFLNPYPRDYRKGAYKFKSTPIGMRPTRDDLRRVLQHGVAGTAMPSFHLLPDAEVEALLDYVIYLSIRGEMERRLWQEVTQELDEGDRLVTEENMDEIALLLTDDFLPEVVDAWLDAEPTAVPARPQWNEEETLASIQRGKELYYGTVANCYTCHGDSQLGDGQTTEYDDWAKEFYDWVKITDREERETKLEQFLELGGLPPRNIIPRNLRQGVYRGGRRPVDIYWRLRNGIEGTPMPMAAMRPPGADPETPGLTEEDIWNMVDYVQSLPYESMTTHGSADQPVYTRARP